MPQAVSEAAQEYDEYYKPEQERLRKEKADREAARQQREMEKLKQDMARASVSGQVPSAEAVGLGPKAKSSNHSEDDGGSDEDAANMNLEDLE